VTIAAYRVAEKEAPKLCCSIDSTPSGSRAAMPDRLETDTMSTRPRLVIEAEIGAAEAALREADERHSAINEHLDALEEEIGGLRATATRAVQAALARMADLPAEMKAARAQAERYVDEVIGARQTLATLQAELAAAPSGVASTSD
jgi:chromosome segregation ATPase